MTGGRGGSAERYATPKIIYMYNINYNFYCYVCLFIQSYLYTYYYKHVNIPHNCNCVNVGSDCKPISLTNVRGEHIPKVISL